MSSHSSLTKKIPSLRDFYLENKVVFIRCDFNVPIKGNEIQNDFRIRKTLPTIKYLLERKAKIVLATHLGRPKGKADPKYSVQPLAYHLSKLLNKEIIVTEDPIKNGINYLLRTMNFSRQIIFLENLRFSFWEEANDVRLAENIASYTDIYINDAFSSCHRTHASVFHCPQLIKKSGMGFLLEKEIKELEKLTCGEKNPFALILGGAKVKDKIPLLKNLADKTDCIFIGGGMSYTFLKALGYCVGQSLVDKDSLTFAKDFINRMSVRDKKVFLPIDHKVTSSLASLEFETTETIPFNKISCDIGRKTMAFYEENLKPMKMIFWNGPMGVFENPSFKEGTRYIAKVLQKSKAYTVVGGGDSVSALHEFGCEKDIDYISTGGGASLDFLKGEEPVGIKALRKIFF